MQLTTPQTAERLGVSTSVVDRLRRNGDLRPVNGPKDGQSKCFWKYDSKVVDELRRARNLQSKPQPPAAAPVNGNGSYGSELPFVPPAPPAAPVVPGIVTTLAGIDKRLEAIESTLATLAKLWT